MKIEAFLQTYEKNKENFIKVCKLCKVYQISFYQYFITKEASILSKRFFLVQYLALK